MHGDILTDGFVRDLHRRMFGQVWRWAGRYRTTDKNLGHPWPQIPAHVRLLCEDTAYWIREQTYGWDELAARFHHRLVAIHPFPNGNGRHARLMTDTLLKKNGLPMFTWGQATLRAGEARARYLDALRAADDRQFGRLIAFARS
jgi:Fic-DOC domain mobile mystery protein B